jgi:predicted DNA-binding protein
VQLSDALPHKVRVRSSSLPLRVLAVVPSVAGYNVVILSDMKTAISLPDDTFQRVDQAARRLGVSRSEFFARAAERWLDTLEDDGTTEAINRVIDGLTLDHAFTDAAAATLAVNDRI